MSILISFYPEKPFLFDIKTLMANNPFARVLDQKIS